MLKRYATFVSLFRSACDVFIVGIVWIFVFFVRFHSRIFDISKGIPSFKRHLILTVPVVFICYLGCRYAGLYKSRRIHNIFLQLMDIFKASIFSWVFVLAFFYYIQDSLYSRRLQALFIVMLFLGLSFSHLFVMLVMHRLRQKGYNLRYYAVIGAGRKGQQLVQDVEQLGWLGLKCAFFVDNNQALVGKELLGAPVYGPIEKLPEIVKNEPIDEVFLALGGDQAQQAFPVLDKLQSTTGITVRIIPDWGNLASTSGGSVMTIGSQVLFSAADSPLNDANIIMKEIFDRVVAILLLAIFAIPMVIIVLLMKLTGRGPVFYKQTRVGMNQKEFEIIKFRTMYTDAEKQNGPQWTKSDDNRRTRSGAWLRRTSLDELPQLINVLKGQMSLVGPRPERPVFAKRFSEEYKKYMLRHKVKAGITGWAQINGFRGDTSLRKRLLYDLYYVRNWSLGFDLWILLLTPLSIIKGMNAY